MKQLLHHHIIAQTDVKQNGLCCLQIVMPQKLANLTSYVSLPSTLFKTNFRQALSLKLNELNKQGFPCFSMLNHTHFSQSVATGILYYIYIYTFPNTMSCLVRQLRNGMCVTML